MIGAYKVVAITFVGRREMMELLAPIVARHRDTIDEWLLCWNVRNPGDEAYIRSLAEDLTWARIVYKPAGAHNYHDFYRDAADPAAVYLKLDDDIIWAENDAITKLLRFRVEHPEFSLVSANVINHVRLSHLHQRFGMLETEKEAGWSSFDPVGWSDGQFAEHVHRRFLASIAAGTVDGWKFNQFRLNGHERLSINCISFFGSDMAKTGCRAEDELFLSTEFGQILGKKPVFYGQAVVVHYAFGPQYAHLHETDILSCYRALSRE